MRIGLNPLERRSDSLPPFATCTFPDYPVQIDAQFVPHGQPLWSPFCPEFLILRSPLSNSAASPSGPRSAGRPPRPRAASRSCRARPRAHWSPSASPGRRGRPPSARRRPRCARALWSRTRTCRSRRRTSAGPGSWRGPSFPPRTRTSGGAASPARVLGGPTAAQNQHPLRRGGHGGVAEPGRRARRALRASERIGAASG